MLLPVTQFAYNATLQKGISMSLFKVNYGYNSVMSLTLRQAKKLNKIAKKKRVKKLIILHKKLCKSAKLILKKMKMYYNKKRSERPDLKKRDKVWLLHKNFKN